MENHRDSATCGTAELKRPKTPVPEVSVIVVTYNQGKSIARALDSILGQKTNFPYEIIIGEDGSTDSTRTICEEYVRRYPDRVFLLPAAPNKGVVKNYFDAFRACRGKLIADCAGDDRWSDPEKMQRQRNFMSYNDDVSIYFTAWTNVCDGKQVNFGYLPPDYWYGLTQGRQLLVSYLAHRLPLMLSTALYRRDILAEALEKEPEWIENPDFGCEDLPVVAALLSRGEGMSEPVSTFEYTVGNPESITEKDDPVGKFDFYFRALEASVRLADHYDVERSEMERHIVGQVAYLLSIARDTRSRELIGRVRSLVKTYSLPANRKSRFFMLFGKRIRPSSGHR